MSRDFFNHIKKTHNIDLNPQQKKAVLHRDGPALVLAVPGAGKTTVLICRTAHLINHCNVLPKNILSLTFSKASAIDMKIRFLNLFGEDIASSISFSTIHSFSYRLIREYAYYNRIQYTLIEDVKSDISKNYILKKLYHEINHSHIHDDKLEELINAMGYVQNMMLSEEEIRTFKESSIDNFHTIYNKYNQLKKKNNWIDFDDMLSLANYILDSSPNLLNKYRNLYKYIQVDEGQDTSKLQNKIIEKLAYPDNNIFIVADDDQSIYGFRGAFPEALLRFNDHYKKAKIFYMEENFRSSNNIVSVSNDFIKSNRLRYTKNLFTRNPNKTPITIVKLKDEYEQLDYVINDLKNLDYYSDVAILYRNNLSAISLVDKLNRNNIPFYMRDTKPTFFNHWLLHDLVSFFKLILDQGDIHAFEKIYYKMKGYISKKAVQYVKNNRPCTSVFETLLDFPDFKSFQKKNIGDLRSDFKFLSRKSPFSAINYIEDDLEYGAFLKERCKKFGFSYENIKNILAVVKLIALETNSFFDFLNRLNELQNLLKESKKNRDSNSITLSTLHSSKGLEFKQVYVMDLTDGEVPTSSSIEAFENRDYHPLEEERRLFYVGMTRAKEALHLITINNRNNHPVTYSRFINELEEIVEDPNAPKNSTLDIGASIVHKKFGYGKIKHIQDNIVIVDFETNGTKQLSLKFCLENEIIYTEK